MSRGFFLALEGGEGSGKSSVAAAMQWRLGGDVVVTREPGGTAIAERIRGLILADETAAGAPWCEAMLFAAARADHAENLIRPALDRGATVVTDRYIDSSVAYQGVARGLGADEVRQVSLIATGGLVPDLTVVLDLDPVVGLDRVVGHNRLDAEGLEFHQRVREAFLDFASAAPDRYAVVSAEQPLSAVIDGVAAAVSEAVSR